MILGEFSFKETILCSLLLPNILSFFSALADMF